MAKNLTAEEREEIILQSLREIQFARRHKQSKIDTWQKNEDLYYGKKQKSTDARANVDLGRMQEFVHTILSKIDNPLEFKFVKRKDAQLRRAQRLNALRKQDSQRGFWDLKDLLGKKQAIIYGRSINFYYATSENGRYQSHFEPVDVYDFLIDPRAGGLDVEKARYLGRYGVIKDRYDLEKEAGEGEYDKETVRILLEGSGNGNVRTQEEINKQNRQYANDGKISTFLKEEDKFVFWQWFTTYKGRRYYLLLNEKGAAALKIVPLEELFLPTDDFPKGAFPVWTWAAFPDLTEFWTPSYCDYVREIFMAQAVTVNQAIDNTEQVNKPQKVVDISSIQDEASLKYRKDGIIKTKGGVKANEAVQLLQVPSIDTPIKLFQLLESIQEKASGVTAAAKGVAEVDGKVGIYEGNQENVADRFGLLNKSYSFGYNRFAQLYEIGVRLHLNKKIAVEMLGPEGIEIETIGKSDIFRKTEGFSLVVESSKAEEALSSLDKQEKNAFLTELLAGQLPVNVQKVIETKGKLVGYTEQEIKQLLDVNNFATQELLSEAERDIESILDGKVPKPNPIANIAYKQRFLDYMQDHEEDMKQEQFIALAQYLQGVEEIVNRNLIRQAEQSARMNMSKQAPMNGMDPALQNNPVPLE